MDTAVKRNRKVAITGRSMLNNVTIAAQLGYLRIPAGQIIRVEDTKQYPDDQVLILTTGSQGEEMSALARMASGEHKQVKIKKGDTVVFSASPIPGNEVSVYGVIDDLFREGAAVIYDKHMHVHVSGHACYDEQKQMIAMTNPRYFIPVHGEYRMLVHHAELARSMNIADDHTFIIDNGEVIEIDAKTSQFAKAKQKAHSGLVLVDGSGIGDVGEIVLRDRKLMSQDGIFVVIMTMEKSSGRLMSSPDIISRGFVYLRENEELIHRARQEVKKALTKKDGTPPPTANYVKNKVRDAVGDLLWAKTKRRPMVLPVLIEV
jgi:ribonuclease J